MMAVQLLACPLCSQPGFTTLDSLRDGLISAASRQLICPVCQDVLVGLDKFTIHLFTHCVQTNVNCPVPSSGSDEVIQEIGHGNNKCFSNLPFVNALNQMQAECISQGSSQDSLQDSFIQGDQNVKNAGNNCQSGDNKANNTTVSIVTNNKLTKKNVHKVKVSPKLNSVTDFNENISTPDSVKSVPISESFFESYDLSQSDMQLESNSDPAIAEETRCDLCGIAFNNNKVLLMHKQLVHSREGNNDPNSPERKTFGCFLCTKVFKMRGSLMVHLRVAHGASNVGKNLNKDADVEERPIVCSACGKTFTKEQHLNQHMKTHEEKQWSCDVCQKLFTTKYFLKKHKRLHTGEMPYSCNICHKSFTFQQSMHKHALYHSNDKPHACPDCHRTFKELSTLTNHRRIHTGEKPFSCETCGKCFRQRVSYLVHRRIHTGAMPYQCTACGKSFRYKVSERTHKCPSQPPGTIIRQAGELLQKLQERAATQATSLGTNISDREQVAPVSPITRLDTCADQHQNIQHFSGGMNQSNLEAAQCLMSVDSQGSFQSTPVLLSPALSLHDNKGKPSELAHQNSTPSTRQPLSGNLPMIEAQTVIGMNQQYKNTSSQFIIILDNLQSSRNLVVAPTVVDVSSQTVQVNSLFQSGIEDSMWCQQPSSFQEDCASQLAENKLPTSPKDDQWSDAVFGGSSSSESDTRRNENMLSILEKDKSLASKDGDKSGVKHLDLELPEATDFFSVLDNLPSPSERLRNLTISPTLKNDTKGNEVNKMEVLLPYQNPTNSPQISNRTQDALQTINEESLKQLLYGTTSDET